jgi:hypothetical protein
LRNQVKIYALQEYEFERVLRNEIWWFDALMLWRVPLICLQSVIEELLWGVLTWFYRVLFFNDFKRRWKRLENFWESPYLKSLSWRKFISLRNSFHSLNWGTLFIETCKGSQVLFNDTWYNFIGWYLLTESCIYDKISWISHFKRNFLLAKKYMKAYLFSMSYISILFYSLKKITRGEIWLVEKFVFL